MTDVMIARHGAMVVLDGTPHRVRRGRTTAHVDSQVVRDHPELWAELVVDFPATSDTPAPAAKDVRAWAKAEGLDVPARGALSADVYAAYEAAQEQ